MFLNLFKSRLSRYIVTWVFTSIIVIEIIILIPSYWRRKNELLGKIEKISDEVFATLIYQNHSEADARKLLEEISRNLKPESLIKGGVLLKRDGKLISKFGEQPEIASQNFSNLPVMRAINKQGNRYDIAWIVPMHQGKYLLVIRHDATAVQKELFAFSLRISGLIIIISIFVTLTTMLTLGVVVIKPILQLRDDLVAAGEAISENGDDPKFTTLSLRRADEMGEVIWAFSQMFSRVRQEITNRQKVESCLRDEQDKSERLLLNILPAEIAQELKKEQSTIASGNERSAIAQRFDEVTILFADIVSFTSLATQISPIELVNSLNQIFSSFDRLAEAYGLEKIKTIGDAYMVVGGLPTPRADHAIAVAKMALDMQKSISHIQTTTGQCFQLRIGINTGAVVAGVIGLKKFSYDLWGDAVNLASRMESHGVVGKIQVSEATYSLIKDAFQVEKRGVIPIKGRGEICTYFLLAEI
ncbi:adenylate/guanylate cyclase with integral membrane sensor [Richelia sinica FACHB-800]|uniref:Adenylate cyclase n=1 Tax=Richelia sinica FACHB-800 TaxID=1357546 RepID=A0A975Y3R8_9NOST|nr:adenylate/guanylate cyclase domain-containing protein [Richelia sinica]MBD2664339.1 adenylate/guanylate cyclase domain-containing protein [Richelia sinica FACHB-800]QXE22425.1 adenylate/guanylate cyclase with integral membrane sensor [Richelia sinica FACHB-800]